MSLNQSNKLGPYEILSPLGAGGMGEVYKARDTRLDRTVAVKILSQQLSSSADAKARFEREAKSIAALNHPHICTLHDVGEQDGTSYLVMEYLEGQTLAQRLEKGPMPIAEALKVATEIADALDKAHRVGVIHRDLKPANIMLTGSGAKLLDFGLAKLRTADPKLLPMTVSAAPTDAKALTMQGTVLGTLQYMSPEQLEGKEADPRTDIFAFGTTLYEMIAGKKAFEGKSQVRLMAAILEDNPVPLLSIQPSVSKDLDRLIAACLVKNPNERWQTARDLLRELQWVQEDIAARAMPAAPQKRQRPFLRKAVAMAHALVTAGLVVTLARIQFRSEPAAITRFQVLPPANTTLTSLTAGLTGTNSGTISPDGRRLVWVATDASGRAQLWTRSLDATTAQPLNGTENASLPFWSPDSRFIGFFADGKLKKILSTGGPAQTLCDATGAPRGGTWSKDGVLVFSPSSAGPLLRVPADGGPASPITDLNTERQEIAHLWPSFLPDGRRFLYVASATTPANAGIYVGDLDSKENKRLINVTTNAIYAPPGYLLYTRENTLVAQRFDASSLEFSGEPVPVAEGVATDVVQQISAFSASDTGTITFRTGGNSMTLLTWFDRNGKRLESVGQAGNYTNPVLSPDQTRAAVTRSDTQSDIWTLDITRSAFSRFTFNPAVEMNPVWSPDGRTIAFTSTRDGGYSIYQKPASGAGQEELVMKMPGQTVLNDWSPDGKHLLFFVSNPKTSFDVGIIPVADDGKIQLLVQSDFLDVETTFSPDGRWLAYTSNETGRFEVYVQPVPPNGARWQVSTTGGRQPSWRRDGNELFYVTDDRKLYTVDVRTNPSFQVSTPRLLFEMQANTVATRNSYVASPDGKRFLVNMLLETTSSPITVVMNALPES